jgi:serine/threonine protein kinase
MGESNRDLKGMTVDAAIAFRSALLGLKVLHDEDWVHRDLKPPNIGLFDKSLHSVLLDVGTSRHIQRGTKLQPRSGTLGTIGYIAPELELEDYDHSIDIWAMGIILFELTYNYHPWKFAINPWRAGEKNEKLRPEVQKSYQSAINLMVSDYKSACASPTQGYIHRECLRNVSHKFDSAFLLIA